MSQKHPVVAITGSSGAGTSSVMRTFDQIFRREGVEAAFVEGDSFHRYDRTQMREAMGAAVIENDHTFSHFGANANLLLELEGLFRDYGETGTGKVRKYLHNEDIQLSEGDEVQLPAGSMGYITQSLGGSFTVFIEGNLFRIAGSDADALGKEPLPVPQLPDGASDDDVEKLVWKQLRTCFDPEIPINVVDLGLVYQATVAPHPERPGERLVTGVPGSRGRTDIRNMSSPGVASIRNRPGASSRTARAPSSTVRTAESSRRPSGSSCSTWPRSVTGGQPRRRGASNP